MSAIQVLDRAVQILDVLAKTDKGASLKIISAETALHPSTAFRILASLGEHALVERDAAGDYRLGTRWLSWGERVRSRIDIRHDARPVMEWLRDQTGETVNLTVQEGDEVVYVERVSARKAIRVEQVVGSRAPLHVTAVGKLMLGEMGDEAVTEYAQRNGLRKFTKNTLTTPESLLDEIHQSIANGFAWDKEEAELGVGCIGVVVRNENGDVVAGLSVSSPIDRLNASWVELVKNAGNKISRQLGYAKP